MSSQPIREHRVTLPLDDAALDPLEPGDVVYLSGTIFTGREGVYTRIFDQGHEPPVDIRSLSNVTFHCSPAICESGPGQFRVTSVTGTASFRFAKYMKEFVERYAIRAIIGKTGMPPKTYDDVFKPHRTVYLNTIGYGLGALYGRAIKRVLNGVWIEELGLAQAMWFFDVEDFGPLMVECDSRGRSLFSHENDRINQRLLSLYEGLEKPILRRLGEETSPGKEML